MPNYRVTRRRVLLSLGTLGLAMPLLQACGGSPAASAPTASTSSTTSTSASAPTSAAASAPTAAPTAAAASATQAPQAQAASSGAKINVSIATYAGLPDEWQREAAKTWAAQNPNVTLRIDDINYGDMAQKQLTELATGTMQDAVFSGIKWFPYSAAKGAFRPIDDYVKANDPGMEDFFSAALAGATYQGKLYGLPYLMHPGNNALIMYDKDMLAAKNVTPPTDDWSVDDYLKLMTTMTDTKNNVWGGNYFPNTYYDFCSMARTWGGDDLSKDGTKFTFATDPKSVEAAQWTVDLRTKLKVCPPRAESTSLSAMFPGKRLATTTAGTYSVLGTGKTIGNRFTWDVVLFPKGPTGIRGYQGFVELFSIFSKSKVPDTAYELLVAESSKATQIMAVLKYAYQPGSRKSVWADPQINKINTIFQRALTWMSTTPGPFPMPANLRFSELEDKWENTSPALFYGEVGFQSGLQSVQQACQAIVDEPAP
jgi:multiple sugar transport system substrate-binding protein